MKTNTQQLKVVEDSTERLAEKLPVSPLRTIAAVVGVTVLLVVTAEWRNGETRAATPAAAASAEPPAAFDYFPAQFVNQASELEEHIPAF